MAHSGFLTSYETITLQGRVKMVEDGLDWFKIVLLFVIGLGIILAFVPRLVGTITGLIGT